MTLRANVGSWLLAGAIFSTNAAASGAQARYLYVPTDAAGNTTQQTVGPERSPGERATILGLRRQPYNCQPRPTHMVTFRHPASNKPITVPLALPQGTPQMQYRYRRVIYNYGSYTVEVFFRPDGSAEVIYDSGLLRDL